jgi:hypothetical protein
MDRCDTLRTYEQNWRAIATKDHRRRVDEGCCLSICCSNVAIAGFDRCFTSWQIMRPINHITMRLLPI